MVAEIESPTPYRQARVDFDSFAEDFAPEETLSSAPYRASAAKISVKTSTSSPIDLAQALRLDIARKDIEAMPDFDMIAVFAMIGPFNPAEKQALLETPDLVSRADLLLALAEVALTRATNAVKPLQ